MVLREPIEKMESSLKLEHVQKKRGLTTGIQVDGNWIGIVQTRRIRGKDSVIKVAQRYLSEDYGVLEFFSEHRILQQKFIISFPRHLATVRFLTLPSTNEAETKEMVRFEAERLLPYSLEELLIDSKIITRFDNGYSKVMAVIVEKTVMDNYLLLLKGFEPESVSLTSIALFNWFINTQNDKSGKSCVLVNAGATSGDIIIVENGILTFTRGIALPQQGWAEKVVAETTSSLNAYTGTEKGSMPEIIILSGVGNELNQLASLMEEKFPLEVEVANAFTGIDVSSSNLNGDYPSPSFVIPMGLVLQKTTEGSDINLLPDYIRERREAREKLSKHVATGILSIMIILLSFFVIFRALTKRNSYLQLLVKENRAMQPLVSQIDTKRKQLDIIKEQLNPGSECLQVLSELYKITPENIVLSTLVLDVGEVVILRGQAKELSEVFTLNSFLEQSPLFENVRVKYANKRRARGKEITDFEIHCLISG